MQSWENTHLRFRPISSSIADSILQFLPACVTDQKNLFASVAYERIVVRQFSCTTVHIERLNEAVN